MLKQRPTRKWKCVCSAINSLRKRCCINCGKALPENIRRDNKINRCIKIGELLAKQQTMMRVLFIVALLVCNGARFYFFSEQTSRAGEKYIQKREERLRDEGGAFIEHLTGIQKLSDVMSIFLNHTIDSFVEVARELTGEQVDLKKEFKEEKIDQIMGKIEEVKIYVTGKFE